MQFLVHCSTLYIRISSKLQALALLLEQLQLCFLLFREVLSPGLFSYQSYIVQIIIIILSIIFYYLIPNIINRMKLTTVKNKENKIKPISNVFKLKKMIQNAANANCQPDKENIIGYSNMIMHQQMQSSCQFPKSLKNGPFIAFKNQRCNSQTDIPLSSRSEKSKLKLANLNFQKLKPYPLSNTNQRNRTHSEKPFQAITKCESDKTINNKKIQGLNKSFKVRASLREQLSISSFILGKKLGKGRFGNVYVAQQKQTKFMLALKIINKKQLKQAEMQQQLVSQIKLQSFMKHPNVLEMYGFFDDHENIYLMLELAEQSLFKDLRRKTCFPQKQVAYYTKQLLEGLKYLHSQNIIHRDLKPQNIMVVNNVLKIADFGWSVYSPFYKRQTFCGTLDYVPPEIVKGDFYDQTADIWSLGVLIFQLTFGYAPFQGSNSEEETFERILSGQFVIPHNVSESLKKIIKYSLIREPRYRLNLTDIQQSSWLKSYQKQGRSISSQIWNYWEMQRRH